MMALLAETPSGVICTHKEELKMAIYEFIEKVNVFMTVEANSEEEAWAKLDEITLPISQDPRVHQESVECFINYVYESEEV